MTQKLWSAFKCFPVHWRQVAQFHQRVRIQSYIVYSISRLLNNKKYFFKKSQGKTLSLKEIAKGDSLARFEPVRSRRVSAHFTICRDPLNFTVLLPRNRNRLWHFGNRVRDFFSQGWTAINGVFYWQFALEVRAQENCEAWENCLRTYKVLKRRSVELFNKL